MSDPLVPDIRSARGDKNRSTHCESRRPTMIATAKSDIPKRAHEAEVPNPRVQ